MVFQRAAAAATTAAIRKMAGHRAGGVVSRERLPAEVYEPAWGNMLPHERPGTGVGRQGSGSAGPVPTNININWKIN